MDKARIFLMLICLYSVLQEMYLIYAEAVLRGGTGGDAARCHDYINTLRTRAYTNASGNITGTN